MKTTQEIIAPKPNSSIDFEEEKINKRFWRENMSIVCVCMWKRYPRFDQKPKLNWSNTNLFYCISNKSWTERKATKITTQMSTCLVFLQFTINANNLS